MTRLASPTATGAQPAARRRALLGPASRTPRRARRGWRYRSARPPSPPISLPVMISSFAWPSARRSAAAARSRRRRGSARPASRACRQRVGGDHAQVAGERELHRAADAGAVDLADDSAWPSPRRGSTPRGRALERPQHIGRSARFASEPTSMPEENIGRSPRSTTQCTDGSSAAARSASTVAITSSWLNALRFSGRLRTTGGPRRGPGCLRGLVTAGAYSRDPADGCLARERLDLLRPPAHRGPLIAAGAVVLAVGALLAELRLGDKPRRRRAPPDHRRRRAGPRIGLQAPNEGGRRLAYQSVLLVTGCSVRGVLLRSPTRSARTSAPEGGDTFVWGTLPPGATVWTSLLLLAAVAGRARSRGARRSACWSPRSRMLALLAAVAWIFDADSQGLYRFLLLACAIGRARLARAARRRAAPRRAARQRRRAWRSS